MELAELYNLVPAEKLEEVKVLLSSVEQITPEKLESFLAVEENLKLISPHIDRAVTKGVLTFKDNFEKDKLPSLLEEEIKKRFPDADPKDVAINELKAEMLKMQSDGKRKELFNLVLKETSGKLYDGFPVESLIGNDAEDTKTRVDKALNSFTTYISPFNEMKEKFELKNPTPGKDKAPVENDRYKELMGKDTMSRAENVELQNLAQNIKDSTGD